MLGFTLHLRNLQINKIRLLKVYLKGGAGHASLGDYVLDVHSSKTVSDGKETVEDLGSRHEILKT